ncbi:PREDICTED: pleckstrin homology domain-containing family G member 1-like [Nicrophorus vespilloides]|uniref:Pleckstrin homology domain-containing family G member 1-like n=1 Tax=Nicrophorus vespilloides TaxID=110193 RepID=A0ABM1MBS4_NICVS|nr:PREDICTED: pleckstrin homology domain-containing family G member 1-like [Nicrophorus vespilloides]
MTAKSPNSRTQADIFEDLEWKEVCFCKKLEEIANDKLLNSKDHINFELSVSSYLTSILMYSKTQFLPFLQSLQEFDHQNLLKWIINNKAMFRLYEDFFEIESYLLWLHAFCQDDFPIMDKFYVKVPNGKKESFVEAHLNSLQFSMKELKDVCDSNDDFERAISVIVKSKKRLRNKCNILLGEIMAQERKNIRKLGDYIKDFNRFSDNFTETRRKKLYGNAQEILVNQKPLLGELEMHFQNGDVSEFFQTFLNYKDVFDLYPSGMFLIDDKAQAYHRETYRLDLCIEPTQEMLRMYGEFMRKALKMFDSEKIVLEIVRKVLEMITNLSWLSNEYLAIKAIKDTNIDLGEQGQLLKRGMLQVTIKQQQNEFEVFLFEKSIVFTKRTTQSNDYEDHVLTMNMRCYKFHNEKITFFDRYEHKDRHLVTIKSSESNIEDWHNLLKTVWINIDNS